MRRFARCLLPTLLLLPAILLLWPNLSHAQLDPPTIETISVPDAVAPGETFDIKVTVENGAGTVQDGYITVSFPDGECLTGIDVGSSSGDASVIYPGTEIAQNERNAAGRYTLTEAQVPMAEVRFENWSPNARDWLLVTLTPCVGREQLTVFIRASIGSGAGAARQLVNVPAENETDAIDQQGFPVHERTVRVIQSIGHDGSGPPAPNPDESALDRIIDNISRDPELIGLALILLIGIVELLRRLFGDRN